MRTDTKKLRNDPELSIQFSTEVLSAANVLLSQENKGRLRKMITAQQAVIKNILPGAQEKITEIESLNVPIWEGIQCVKGELHGAKPNIQVVLGYSRQFGKAFVCFRPELGVDNEVKRIAIEIDHNGDIGSILVIAREEGTKGNKNNAVRISFLGGVVSKTETVRVDSLVRDVVPFSDPIHLAKDQKNILHIYSDLEGQSQHELWYTLADYVDAFSPR